MAFCIVPQGSEALCVMPLQLEQLTSPMWATVASASGKVSLVPRLQRLSGKGKPVIIESEKNPVIHNPLFLKENKQSTCVAVASHRHWHCCQRCHCLFVFGIIRQHCNCDAGHSTAFAYVACCVAAFSFVLQSLATFFFHAMAFGSIFLSCHGILLHSSCQGIWQHFSSCRSVWRALCIVPQGSEALHIVLL